MKKAYLVANITMGVVVIAMLTALVTQIQYKYFQAEHEGLSTVCVTSQNATELLPWITHYNDVVARKQRQQEDYPFARWFLRGNWHELELIPQY